MRRIEKALSRRLLRRRSTGGLASVGSPGTMIMMDLRPPSSNRARLAGAFAVLALAARPDGAAGQADIDEPIAGPIDPAAQHAKPRQVSTGAALPDIPATLPDGIAVMAFENNSGVRALDWVVAGIPLVIGERYEHVLGFRPT